MIVDGIEVFIKGFYNFDEMKYKNLYVYII